MHWRTNIIISCDNKEKVIKKQKMKCLKWQIISFRTNTFPMFSMQSFHHKHMFFWQVIYYILLDFLNSYKCQEWTKKKINVLSYPKKTLNVLDNDILVNLFVTTQKNNLDLCIKKSIELVFYLFQFTVFAHSIYRNVWSFGSYFLVLKNAILIK